MVGFALTDWFQIQSGYLTVGEEINLSKLKLMTSIDEVAETIALRTFTPNDAEAAEAFTAEFIAFGWIFTLIAVMIVAGASFVFLSMLACRTTKGRAALAYPGFFLGAAAPLVFIYAVSAINGMAEQKAVQTTLFPYLMLLAGILGMVYCVRYPAISAVKNKRNSFFTRAVTTFVPVKGDGAKESLRKVIFTAALISFVYFGSTLGVDLFNEWRANMLKNKLRGDIGRTVDIDENAFAGLKPLPDYLALWQQNNDMVGYIRLNDTKVDYPVLQTTNNRYYLHHDFDGNASKGGAIFADHRNKFEEEYGEISDNTILYGHNISTGNYFAALSNYHTSGYRFNDLEFYRSNPVIMFDTLFEKMEWKIFACVLFNTQEEYGEVYDYWHQLEFVDENHFHNFVLDIMDRSVMFTDVDLEYGDKLLTLSTCFWPYSTTTQNVDTRCVIFARKIRPGESNHVNVDKATVNTGILRFELEKNRMGNSWNGRVWDYKTYLTSYKND